MTPAPRKSPAVFCLLNAWFTLFVASFSPIWSVNAGRLTGGYMVSGPRHCTLWRILRKRLPADFEDAQRSGSVAGLVLRVWTWHRRGKLQRQPAGTARAGEVINSTAA